MDLDMSIPILDATSVTAARKIKFSDGANHPIFIVRVFNKDYLVKAETFSTGLDQERFEMSFVILSKLYRAATTNFPEMRVIDPAELTAMTNALADPAEVLYVNNLVADLTINKF